MSSIDPSRLLEIQARAEGAVRYAVAVLGNHRNVASDYHAPIIQAHMDALTDLLAALTSEQRARQEAEEKAVEYAEVLNLIASWDEGSEVTPSFDEPCSAQIAREVLAAKADRVVKEQ